MKGFKAFRRFILGAAAFAAVSLAAPVLAQDAPFSDGTYILDGGSYSITIRREGDSLVVVEPNKTSPYALQADGTYHFYNPNTQTTYGIRVIDNQTVEAFKPGQSGNVPSRLSRVGGAPAAAPPATIATVPVPASTATGAGAIAERYRQLSETDPNEAQAWTACAAAAKKRELATAAEADAYGRQMAQVLKLIVTDPSRSPCDDAIPASVWSSAGEVDDAGASVAISEDGAADAGASAAAAEAARAEAERARLEELNRRADAREAAAKAEAERLAQEQRAYEQRMAEVKAGEEKFARDQAAYEAELARVKAAEAEYQRKQEEYRQLLASGKFATPE